LFNDGPTGNFRTVASLNVGADLAFSVVGGWGTSSLCLESQLIVFEMELNQASDALDHNDELDRDYITDGVPSVIQDAGDNVVTVNGNGNYDIPSPSNTAKVFGGRPALGTVGGSTSIH
jgi:hypothetical protein